MSKHTPGPWKLTQIGKRQSVADTDGGEIATIAQGIDANPADATLIAAAPDLIEAAQYVIAILEGDYPDGNIALDKCRAAIAKATQ